MKKSSILAIATVLITILSSSSLLADPPEGKGWKVDKEQKKYEKEMRKKEREYEREEAKKRREMEREEAKHRREYEREELKHREEMEREDRKYRKEMDREDRERYEDDDRDDYEYRRDRYESESSIQDDALDTAVESAMPESLKGTAAEDVIREEAKRWWER